MKKVISGRPSLMAEVMDARNEDARKSDSEPQAFIEIEKVLSAAANVDALKIFYAAKEGIKSSTQAIEELNLTQKRYYTHLKNLIEIGVIEKVGETYQLTTFGKVCAKLLDALQNSLGQRGRLDLVDRVSKTKNISLEETEEIMHAILKDLNITPNEQLLDFVSVVRMVDTWDGILNGTIEYVEKAEKEILFASQYVDSKTFEPVLKALQRGIEMKVIASKKENYAMVFQMIRSILTNPGLLRYIKGLKSSKLHMKYVDLPYTLLIVDGKHAMVEVHTPHTEKFSLAFFFTSQKIAEKLKDEFDVLWQKGSEMEEKTNGIDNESA